jgi:hypothetical protein
MFWLAIAVAIIVAVQAAPWLYAKAKAIRLPNVKLPNPLTYPVPMWQVLVLGAAVWMAIGGPKVGGCKLPVGPWPIAQKATAVTYVYEKDSGGVPSAVGGALDKLNRREPPIMATAFEEDTKDATGDTPLQYKAALIAAQAAGLPVLVVQAGDKVLKVVKAPKTDSEVLEAVP